LGKASKAPASDPSGLSDLDEGARHPDAAQSISTRAHTRVRPYTMQAMQAMQAMKAMKAMQAMAKAEMATA
jgi:hypothetical protein